MAHMVSVDWRIYEYQVPGNVTNTLSLANDLHDFYGNPHQPWLNKDILPSIRLSGLFLGKVDN